jgi:hypothetical protein
LDALSISLYTMARQAAREPKPLVLRCLNRRESGAGSDAGAAVALTGRIDAVSGPPPIHERSYCAVRASDRATSAPCSCLLVTTSTAGRIRSTTLSGRIRATLRQRTTPRDSGVMPRLDSCVDFAGEFGSGSVIRSLRTEVIAFRIIALFTINSRCAFWVMRGPTGQAGVSATVQPATWRSPPVGSTPGRAG